LRVSPLRKQFAAWGATFGEQQGREVVESMADARQEYLAVREAVGLTDFSFVQKFRVPTDQGLDLLDLLVAGNVPRIRFGRVLHTFLADEDGWLIGDCYVANNDEEMLFLCESIVPDAAVLRILKAQAAETAGLEDWTESHVLLSLDGLRAWAVVKEIFGSDVLGLPYLSLEVYPFEGNTVRLFRAGKTGEFGYLLLAPVEIADALLERLFAAVDANQGRTCGLQVHHDLRLEGRFFNIHAEGRQVRDPLVLGLQWMVDFSKETFCGSDALYRRRAAGLKQKIIGVSAEPGRGELVCGAQLFNGAGAVARVVADCFSPLLDQRLGLAVFPVEWAYAGLTFQLGASTGPAVKTISMPPIMPKSLRVKLDEV